MLIGSETADHAGAVDRGTSPRLRLGGNRNTLTWLERFGVPIGWIVVIAVFGTAIPNTFLTMGTLSSILGSQAVLVVVTLGLIVPLRAGDFDLSVASTLTLASVTVVVLNGQDSVPLLVAVLAAIGIGLVVGAVNGMFVLFFRINSLIVTLGVGQFLLGVALIVSQGEVVSGVSQSLTAWVVTNRFLDIPVEFYYGLALAAVVWYLFEFTALGRRILFTGVNQELARLSGVRVTRVRFGSFIVAGVIAAVAGVMYAGTSGSADPTSGSTYLLPAFASAFLGATTIVPGRFNPWGTVVAAYFLVTGITGFAMLGAGTYVQDLFYGAGLVVAVSLSQMLRGRIAQQFS